VILQDVEEHHVVFDDSALLIAGSGNWTASTLIHYAQTLPGWYVYAPTCALVEADRRRRGVAEHFASIEKFHIPHLDVVAAISIANETTRSRAHTGYSAKPSAENPRGALIATADPERWKGEPVRIIDLTI
jgi:hypothetical protein